MLVAVYGTLKRGFLNYHRLLAGKEPLFEGFAAIPFFMYANGEYPMLVPAESRRGILLEVFDVDEKELQDLDALEEPYGYRRETIFIEEMGKDVEIYLHEAPPPPGFELVESGDWPL